MTERIRDIDRCSKLCEFFSIFYRKLPPIYLLNDEFEKLKLEMSLSRDISPDSLVVHVIMLDEDQKTCMHYETIKSFMRQGKIGYPNHTSLTNYMNRYVERAIIEYPNDLVLIATHIEGDICWDFKDRHGHRGGYPLIPYQKDIYGEPVVRCYDHQDITHLPPDKILGFYHT